VKVELQEIARCFEGMVPPVLVTCSVGGEPNITHLSQLQVLDGEHVAASNQFFGKTVTNLDENPRACALVIDHERVGAYLVHLEFEERQHEGPIFDDLSSRVDAIAAMTGMGDVFRLRSADIYRVLDCERL
jgi:adenylate cyclase